MKNTKTVSTLLAMLAVGASLPAAARGFTDPDGRTWAEVMPGPGGRLGLQAPPWGDAPVTASAPNAASYRIDYRIASGGEVQASASVAGRAGAGIPVSLTNDRAFVLSVSEGPNGGKVITPGVFRSGVQMLVTPGPGEGGAPSLRWRIQYSRIDGERSIREVTLFNHTEGDVQGEVRTAPGLWTSFEMGEGSGLTVSFRVRELPRGCPPSDTRCL